MGVVGNVTPPISTKASAALDILFLSKTPPAPATVGEVNLRSNYEAGDR
jgi:hypothetical protein